MDAKLLTESGLRAILLKHKIKDNGLEKALAAYEKLDDNAYDDCLETIAHIGKLAAALKKVKEVAADKAVADYLDDVMEAADAEEKDVSKAKATAAKTDAAKQNAVEKEKGDKDKEDGEDEDDEGEEEEGEYGDRLLTAFKKCQTMNGEPMDFIICEAQPFPAIMMARRVTSKHRKELTEMTDGSKKFHRGTCRFEDGKYIITTEQEMPGLVRRVQLSVKNHTGKKFKFVHGDETAEGDEQPPVAAADATKAPSAAGPIQPEAPPMPEPPALAKAPEVWQKTLDTIAASIEQLKAAALKDFADDEPEIVDEVKELISRFDAVLLKLDHSLADSLAKAHAAQDPTARNTELKNSKRILIDYLQHVKSDALIAHIDANPFGVRTNLKQHLAEGLKHMAEAIGKSAATA